MAATAASTAEPPRRSVSIAIWVAIGCAVPAAPLQPMAAERVAKLAPNGRSPACTSGRVKRSAPGGWKPGSGSGAGGGAPPWPGALVVAPDWPGWAAGCSAARDDGSAATAAAGRVAMKDRRRTVRAPRCLEDWVPALSVPPGPLPRGGQGHGLLWLQPGNGHSGQPIS